MKFLKNKLKIIGLLFVCVNLLNVLSVSAQEITNVPKFISNKYLSTQSTRFVYQDTDSTTKTYLDYKIGLNVNPIFGLRVKSSTFETNSFNTNTRRFLSFANFKVPKNSFEREAMAYKTITNLVSIDNSISYEHYLQFRLISLNESHVGVNFIHGRYVNGGSWAQYVNTIWYIPIQEKFYDFDIVLDSAIHYNNGYKHSLIYFLIFNLENGGKHVYTRYMNSAGLDFKPFYISYTYFENSLPVYFSDPEISYVYACESYYNATQYTDNAFYSHDWYITNSLSNRYSLQYINPDLPVDQYWEYSAFYLQQKQINVINLTREYSIYNDTINETEYREYSFIANYTEYAVSSTTTRYYYSTQTIDPINLGNWGWWNFLRNGLTWIVNLFIFVFQFVGYLLVLAFNYLLLWILFQLFCLIWNYPIQWIFYGIIAVVFYISFFFVWLWNQIVVLWKQIIEPLLNWIWNETVAILRFIYNWLFKEGGLQTLVNLYLTLVSYILAAIFFVLTAGLINFTETQQAMVEFLIQLNSVFFQIGSIFIRNFPLLIGYSGTYILLVGLVYLKYIYAKSRGYTTRATKLQSMINVYKLPMVLLIRLSQYVVGFIQGGVPTDGADK